VNFIDWDARLINPDTNEQWIPWSYQEQALDSNLNRKFQRWSRRSGKTKAAAAEALYFADTFSQNHNQGRGCSILVLAPELGHLEHIFDVIRGFVSKEPYLQAKLDRNICGYPPVLSFSNETEDRNSFSHIIRGFSTARIGRGLAARGCDADLIILDEAAYVCKEAIENIVLPFMYTRPETKISAYSTPSGEESWFDTMCTKYGSHHVTIHSCPRTNDEATIASVRKEFGHDVAAYNRQCLAL